MFWLLSKGSVASSEQTKYWSQLNITFPFVRKAFREVVVVEAKEREERRGCSVTVQCPLTCERPPEAECGVNNMEVRICSPCFITSWVFLPAFFPLLPPSVTLCPLLLLSLYYAEMGRSSALLSPVLVYHA